MTGFWTRRLWLALAAISGFISVGFGAFAAHGLKDDAYAAELLRTGSTYGFIHTLAVFAAAVVIGQGGRRARLAPAFFLVGVLLFSGSLYALALGAPSITGMITPFGGLAFMAGWLILAWAALGIDRN